MASFHFLLIDDNELDLFINEKFLSHSGLALTIQSFNSAEDGLQYINKEADDMPETILLLDLQMPGMNGFDFVNEFATYNEEWRKKITIYILSSTVDRGDIERAKNNPFIKDIISKPLDIDLLQELLEKDSGEKNQ